VRKIVGERADDGHNLTASGGVCSSEQIMRRNEWGAAIEARGQTAEERQPRVWRAPDDRRAAVCSADEVMVAGAEGAAGLPMESYQSWSPRTPSNWESARGKVALG
jgi:hypothetical protein